MKAQVSSARSNRFAMSALSAAIVLAICSNAIVHATAPSLGPLTERAGSASGGRPSPLVVSREVLDGDFPLAITTIATFASPREFVLAIYGDVDRPEHVLAETLSAFVTADGREAVAVALWAHAGWDLLVVVGDGDAHLQTLRTPIALENGLEDVEAMVGVALHRNDNLPPPEAYLETTAARHQVSGDSWAKAGTSPGFGAVLGSFNGVPAYSNLGSETTTDRGTNIVNGYTTGYRWQCVEFVNRYFWLKFGKKISGGNANVYYGRAASKGLNRAENGGALPPIPGNLICSNGGPDGHCAIVTEVSLVNGGHVKTIGQNWSSSTASKTLTLSIKKRKGISYYTVGGFSTAYPIAGWMFPKP